MIVVGYTRMCCPLCGAGSPRQYGNRGEGGRRTYLCGACDCRFAAMPVPQPVLACPSTIRSQLTG